MLNADGSANSARMCADDKFMCVQNLNAAVTAGCQTVRFFNCCFPTNQVLIVEIFHIH